MKWKKSRLKKGTPAITAEASLSTMKKAESKKSGLRAINDIYIIEEEPVETVYETGLTSAVTDAIKEKKLFIPDAYSNFAEKYPCRGKVIAKGSKCKEGIEIGDRVIYARLGVQRYTHNNKLLCDVRECDIHAVVL